MYHLDIEYIVTMGLVAIFAKCYIWEVVAITMS